MNIARRLGILVFFAVPAIVGGGIVFHFSQPSYTPMAIYEILLILFAGAIISK